MPEEKRNKILKMLKLQQTKKDNFYIDKLKLDFIPHKENSSSESENEKENGVTPKMSNRSHKHVDHSSDVSGGQYSYENKVRNFYDVDDDNSSSRSVSTNNDRSPPPASKLFVLSLFDLSILCFYLLFCIYLRVCS
jgi:hypothetical protein